VAKKPYSKLSGEGAFLCVEVGGWFNFFIVELCGFHTCQSVAFVPGPKVPSV